MPDFRPALILIVYLLAIAAVWVFAGGDTTIPIIPDNRLSVFQSESKVSIEVSGEDTATTEETITCEVRLSVDSTETTATTVNVSDTITFANGALLEIIDATPSFEDTEPAPGGGLKINWGSFQLVGGETLNVKLRLKATRNGVITNMASAKIANRGPINSRIMTVFILPPKESTSTTITSSNFGFPLNKNLSNSIFNNPTNNNHFLGNGSANTGKSSSATQKSSGKRLKREMTKNTTTTTRLKPSSTTSDTGASVAFSDVKKGDWFEGYIGDLIYWDIIKGYPDNTFKPSAMVNRAEFTAFVVRGTGAMKYGPEPFADVKKSDWFYPVVASAYNLGLIGGVSEDRFAPSEELTREQAAVISVKLAEIPVDTDTSQIEGWLQGFADRGKISDWARPFVATSVKYNLLKGYPDNRFNPKGSIIRAEASTLIYRLFFEKLSFLMEFPDYVTPSSVNSEAIGPAHE